MLSSITSSDDRLPHVSWRRVIFPAIAAFIAFVVSLEVLLHWRGIEPTVADSEARWQKERNRADDLGRRALILVGASRMQIDTDLDEARRATHLEPVQLAVSGENWLPILAGLAEDPEIKGAVVVDFDEQFIAFPELGHELRVEEALMYQQHFKRTAEFARPSDWAEAWLIDGLRQVLRSYADDGTPGQSLSHRVFSRSGAEQYITTKPDRSRAADFSRVLPSRALLPYSLLNHGKRIPLAYKLSIEARRAELSRAIDALEIEDNREFLAETRALRAMVGSIQQRGGRVYFIRMPSDGWVRRSYEKRFPRALFWDMFSKEIGAPAINFEDAASLKSFECPDGYHLDYHDRTAFTAAMLRALGLADR